MTDVRVITNHHWRQFKYQNELTPAQLQDSISDYDHLEDGEEFANWIVYRGDLYHVSDFLRVGNVWQGNISPDNPLSEWHGYNTDSYFSAVVINLSDCGEAYQIGLMLS